MPNLTAPAAQPPPNVPSMPDVSAVLTTYLRTFALWCRNGFADKLSATTALPDMMLLSPGGLVYKIKIGDGGLLTSTPIALGGKEGKPITFAPASTASQSASVASPAGVSGSAYKMMGLNLTLSSGAGAGSGFAVAADGLIANSVAGGISQAVICFGTGGVPANGQAQTGTIIGSSAGYLSASAGASAPFSISGRPLNSAITPNTTYWFDLALQSTSGGGTATVTNLNMIVWRLL